MKAKILPLIAVTLTTAVLASTAITAQAAGPTRDVAELRKMAVQLIGTLPDKMPGSEGDTSALIKLGKRLYFDKQLSVNNTISCNSCHGVDKKGGGVDNEPTSPGAFGKRGGRNSPTVLNAGFQLAQFWDGRAATLTDQAKGPILNPIEMSMPNEPTVLERIKNDRRYPKLFRKAFPESAGPITYHNVAEAIAAFERTLITRDRFDDFQKGKDKALSSLELRGLEAFLTLGCTTCHNSPTMGGNSYQKVGLIHPYENTEDLGRYDVTKKDEDKFKFKVPMLRNIALTGPYFHDGKVKTLDEAVRKMAHMQLSLELKPDQTESIVAFLKALSDKKRAKR